VFAQQSLQPKLSRRRYASVSYALQNNTVFIRAQNWVSVSDGSQTDDGSEFQSVGPETAKHLWPYLIVLERETSRSPLAAKRRWPRLADSNTGEHSSARYDCWYSLMQTLVHQDKTHTFCTQFSAERAANVVISNVSGDVVKLPLKQRPH